MPILKDEEGWRLVVLLLDDEEWVLLTFCSRYVVTLLATLGS